MRTKKLLLPFALALMLVCSGCWSLWLGGGLLVGAGATAVGIAYADGDLKANMDQSPAEVATATEKAFEKMNISRVSKNSSATDEELIGRTAKDEKVKVYVKAADGKGSNLSIRIGVFGNEALSRSIYEEIQKELPAPAGK